MDVLQAPGYFGEPLWPALFEARLNGTQGISGKIEHMFDMKERIITLRGGRFDGKVVTIDARAHEVWAYANMYNQPRAVKAGGLPRSESMVTYRVVDVGDVAECVESP